MKTTHSQPMRRQLPRKRIAMAIALLPITLPFALAHRFAEWWHSTVSQTVVIRMRAIAKQREKFFDRFAPRQQSLANKGSK